MPVDLSRQDEFAIMVLDRPEVLNAMNAATIDEIGRALNHVAGMDVRALIMTGAGDKAFSAGSDIRELLHLDPMSKKRKAERAQSVFALLDTLRVPSVALIHGHAFGGGLELALAATFRLATPTAAMACPEVRLGLIPSYGATQRLPRLIGEGRALELVMTGRTVRSEEALAMGLVNRIVSAEHRLAEAMAFARGFTGHSLVAMGHARDAVRRAHGLSLADGLRAEADISTLAYVSEDAQEGISAFLEKRPPIFRDS
jgi:enoyl-CoA hydratase